MQLTYKLITAAIALTGCISLLITGELVPAFVVPGLAMLPGYYRVLRGYEPAPRSIISLLSLLTIGLLAFDSVAVSGDFFIAVAHMTIVFQALKSFDLRAPWDHLQVYFMSLLQLIMTSEMAISVTVGVMFVIFLIILVSAMVVSHFMTEGSLGRVRIKKPLAIVMLVIFTSTVVLFVAIPRAGGGLWSRKTTRGIRSVGFTEKVDFGSFGDALEDPTVVMRVAVEGPRLPLYWRGTTLDHFDGTSWKDTLKRLNPIYKQEGKFKISTADIESFTVQKVHVEPVDTSVLFGLGRVVSVESAGRYITRDRAGSLYLPAKSNRRFVYTVTSMPDGGRTSKAWLRRYYLQVPEGMEQIAVLARQITAGAESQMDIAQRIESHLKTSYSYTLKTEPPPMGIAPIEYFLFNSRKGYCEHFASSMVLMLRTLGIPARVVTGFRGGEVTEGGDYVIVRQSNAHSWVEAAIGARWVRFDPTPEATAPAGSLLGLYLNVIELKWYRYVVGYDFVDQRTLARFFVMPTLDLPEIAGLSIKFRPVIVIVLIGFAIPVFFLIILRLKGRRRLSLESKVFVNFRKQVRRRGGAVRPASTPREVLDESIRLGFDAAATTRFVSTYEAVRFGGMTLSPKGRLEYKQLASSIL